MTEPSKTRLSLFFEETFGVTVPDGKNITIEQWKIFDSGIKKEFSSFADFIGQDLKDLAQKSLTSAYTKVLLDLPVRDLPISVRLWHRLHDIDVGLVGQLVKLS